MSGRRVAFFLVPVLVLMGVGCHSGPDWNTRVGVYTYDQAVAELGPPDKTAKLSDGRTVSEWITHRGGGMSFGVGTGLYGSHSSVGVGQGISTGASDHGLRLTFDNNNRLVQWSRN